MNFLEQLVADWFAHQGYLVSTNLKFGPRAAGGYDGEIDVLAVKLKTRELVHIETSSDADSWRERLERIQRKFDNAATHYESLLGQGFENPRRIAVVSPRRPRDPVSLPRIEIWSFDELMDQIKAHVAKHHPMRQAIPEGYGLLRAVQFTVWFGQDPAKPAASDL